MVAFPLRPDLEMPCTGTPQTPVAPVDFSPCPLTETLCYYSPSAPTPRYFHFPSSMTPGYSHSPTLSHYFSPFSAPSTLPALFQASIPSLSPLLGPSRLSSLQAGSSSLQPAAHRSFAASARFYRALWRRRQRAAGLVSRGG